MAQSVNGTSSPGSAAPAVQTAPVKGPSRQGSPASSRDFSRSSAGGARVKLTGGPQTRRDAKPSDRSARAAGHHHDPQAQRKTGAWPRTYIPDEETLRNDYSAHYARTGERPQNNLRGVGLDERFAEYPKLQTLLKRKHELLDSSSNSIAPTYLEMDNESMSDTVTSLQGHRFDVVVLSPPPDVTYDELSRLDIGSIAANPGFVWLWVGSGASGDGIGLERGRDLLASWGYRRSEDIVWLKTNRKAPEKDLLSEPTSLLTSTIEHCLMGIRGTVRRSTDSWFVHCNVDTDVIVWEGHEQDPQLRPPEMQTLIENFCQGTRRLHLFGSPLSLRRGWLTVGSQFDKTKVLPVEGETTKWSPRAYEREVYTSLWVTAQNSTPEDGLKSLSLAQHLVPTVLPFVQEIDNMRPKSPPPQEGVLSSGGLGRGRGAGLGVTRSAAALAHSPGTVAQRSQNRFQQFARPSTAPSRPMQRLPMQLPPPSPFAGMPYTNGFMPLQPQQHFANMNHPPVRDPRHALPAWNDNWHAHQPLTAIQHHPFQQSHVQPNGHYGQMPPPHLMQQQQQQHLPHPVQPQSHSMAHPVPPRFFDAPHSQQQFHFQ
ncbi:regulatory protein [Microbotryomycetes sp. JL221]|nr:regulatory protein [Microbotryomycetes sp. JL221]